MTREINGMTCTWAWDEAIARAGGQTALAKAMDMSYSRVKQIQKNGTDRVKVAKKAEEVTGVPAVEILKLAPWNPDSRPAPEPGKGRKPDLRIVESEPADDEPAPRPEPELVAVPGLLASSREGRWVRPSRSARSSNRRRQLAAAHLRLVGDHASNG